MRRFLTALLLLITGLAFSEEFKLWNITENDSKDVVIQKMQDRGWTAGTPSIATDDAFWIDFTKQDGTYGQREVVFIGIHFFKDKIKDIDIAFSNIIGRENFNKDVIKKYSLNFVKTVRDDGQFLVKLYENNQIYLEITQSSSFYFFEYRFKATDKAYSDYLKQQQDNDM